MDGPIQNVLVYVDGTEASITAAQLAILISKPLGASLTALYVVNTRALTDLVRTHIFLKEEQDEYQRDIEADAERYLKHVYQLGDQKGVSIVSVKRSGNVHQEIRKYVDESEIDLLVIGELARIRSRRDEIFDEAERAMRGVKCSVLIAKETDKIWNQFEAV